VAQDVSQHQTLSIGIGLGQVSCPIPGRKREHSSASMPVWPPDPQWQVLRAERAAVPVPCSCRVRAVSVPRPRRARAASLRRPCRVRAVSAPRPRRARAASLRRPCRVSAASAPRPRRARAASLRRPCRVSAASAPRPRRVSAASVPRPCRVSAASVPCQTSYWQQPSLQPLHPRQLRSASPNTMVMPAPSAVRIWQGSSFAMSIVGPRRRCAQGWIYATLML